VDENSLLLEDGPHHSAIWSHKLVPLLDVVEVGEEVVKHYVRDV
jgi:hypothetical protein